MKTQTATNQTLHRVGHCLYRSPVSQIYYAILKRAGKQIKRSLKTADAALAKRRLTELQSKAAGINRSESGKLTFRELAARWLAAVGASMKISSYKRQSYVVNVLNAFYGPLVVRGISKANVEQWAAARKPAVEARTFNYDRQTLIRVLDYAVRDGLILDNPARIVKRLRQPKHKVVIPNREQFLQMVAAMRCLRTRALEGANLCEFLAYGGCRLGEAIAMRWGDINFTQKTFTVTGGELGTKNHEARVVPLFPALEQFLVALQASLPQPPSPADRLFTLTTTRTAMNNACTNAGLPHFTHHSLRHFFCSNAIEAGIDFKAIAGWLGHKDGGLLVARTYGHLRDEHSAAMALRMTFGMKEAQNVAAGVKVPKIAGERVPRCFRPWPSCGSCPLRSGRFRSGGRGDRGWRW